MGRRYLLRHSVRSTWMARRKAPQHGSFFGSRASMKLKTVYLNGDVVGSAHTWYEVAALLTELLRFHVSARDAQTRGSEGPDGFFVALPG